jgi:monoamine oxidase
VIGAGLSGLCAADELATRRGDPWKVTVLETRNRLGGRVHSFSFDEARSLVCELGGEWVGLQHERMIGMCRRFKLDLDWHRYDYSFLERGRIAASFKAGAWPFSKDARKAFSRLKRKAGNWSQNQKKEFDRMDWWTILRDNKFKLDELLRRDLMDSTDFGESIRQAGGYSAAAEYFDSNRFDEMDMHIRGGNSQLIKALANSVMKHGGDILTDRRVQRIEQDQRRVLVKTTNGEQFSASFCICTVPARTLTRITFDPPLDGAHKDAAEQLQYARIQKSVLLFENRFWNTGKRKSGFSCFTEGASDFIFDATLAQSGNQGILCSYAIGDKADDLAAARGESLRARIENDLRLIFPEAVIESSAFHRYPWQRDEYTEGAYAFYRPGQWFDLWERLVSPHGDRVFFAGEHLAEDQGFMEGAADTGVEAAKDVVRASNGKPWKKRKRS